MHNFLRYFCASVWLINGLYCKVLGFVPRHEQIVARILGSDNTALLTVAIGIAEVVMTVWILSGIRSRFCAITQIAVVVAMNIIEFVLAPDLLLFGRFNFVIAMMFVGIVYYNEFVLAKARG